MAVQISESFQLYTHAPLDSRFQFKTVAEMKSFPTNRLYEGIIASVVENTTTYRFFSSNENTEETGKWRKLGTGSVSSGEENKINSISVNGSAIPADENKNVDITVPSIEGLATETYVTEQIANIDLTGYAKKTDIPTELPANGGNADTVNSHTVETNVPANAVFTDTVYDDTDIKAEIANKADITAIPSKVSDLENDSNYQTAEQVNSTVTAGIAKVVADAPEDFDTLKEMSDWIAGHENDASAMNSAISDNKTNIETLQNNVSDIQTSLDKKLDKTFTGEAVANKILSTDESGNVVLKNDKDIPVYTTAEYEQIKDTIPEGTKYIISDDYQGSELCTYKKEKIFEPSEIAVHSINHRGANTYAPENTMSAFRISKELGFDMVECDVDFTMDNIPVIIHDSTVDRTSNGTGEVHSFTFEDIRKLDFGSWKSSVYSGEKIPSFDEFILGCRTLGLHPYIEIKVRDYINLELVTTLVNIVHKYNMQDKVTWISFGIDKLQSVVKVDKYARVGFIEESMSTSILDESINRIKTLDTGYNEIFYDLNLGLVNTSITNRLKEEKIKLEVWVVDTANLITNADKYITGFTSNTLRADWVLRDELYADGDDLDFVDLTSLVQKTDSVDSLLYVYAKRKNGYVYMRCFATLGDAPSGEKYHNSNILVKGIPKKYIPYLDSSFAAVGWGTDADGSYVSKVCRISVTKEDFTEPGTIRISESNMVKGDKLRAEWIYPVTYHRKNS